MKKLIVLSIVLFSICLAYSQRTHKAVYKIINKISLEGDGGWDYLFSDDQANRLYVSHADQVQIIDEIKKEVIGKITGLKGVHGIAIAPALNKGFISCGRDSSVTVFDTKTFAVLQRVMVTGTNPDAILFDAFSQKVFVFNARSNNVTVLDAVSNKILASTALSSNPEFAVTNGKGLIYVNLESASSIAVLNTQTDKVENVWPIAPGEEPSGLAFDAETQRLFSVCANKLMMVVDARTGKIIAKLPTGSGTDGVAFDPALKCAYSSNGEGTMTVVKEMPDGKYSVLENVPTQKGARTITVNKLTHHIYLPTANFEAAAAGQRPKANPGSFVVLEIVAQ